MKPSLHEHKTFIEQKSTKQKDEINIEMSR